MGERVNTVLVTALQWAGQTAWKAQKQNREHIGLVLAYLQPNRAFLWSCQQGLGVFVPAWGWFGGCCAALVTWHGHTMCAKLPAKQGHPFPGSSRGRIVPSLQSWLWWFPLPPAAASCQGELRKTWRHTCCGWALQPLHLPLNLLGPSSSHSLLLIPPSPLVHRPNNASVLWLFWMLSSS